MLGREMEQKERRKGKGEEKRERGKEEKFGKFLPHHFSVKVLSPPRCC